MHETYRMLGEGYEADLAREAAKRQLAASVAGKETAGHHRGLRSGVRSGVIRLVTRLLVPAPAEGGGDEGRS
jgi:hypothetical protein